ncbi:MAG: lysophospholipid acyltransferase family protein [Candidatus Omnitrophica bacterium]|nr:lysophospholipid acyltransferase family protein [Candidatus Omnitrophota bacterium]
MKRKPYRFFLYILLEFSSIIILILPYRVIIFLAGFFGRVAYFILPKYRNITLDNLRTAFRGEKEEAELRRIAVDVFRNIAITSAECISMRKFSRETVKRFIKEEDYRFLKKIHSRGKGVIALQGHLGNWEMSAACAVAYGLDVSVIAKRIYYPPYNRFLVSLRENKGVRVIYRDEQGVLKKTLAVLKSGNLLGILADQDVASVKSVFVNFFGQPTYTPVGPVVLAMLSGAPIVLSYAIRENGKLRFITEEPIYVRKSDNRDADILKYTQQWSDALERVIRKYPDQWAWIHKRWKTKPVSAHPDTSSSEI